MRLIGTTAKLISVWLFVILVLTSATVAQSNAKGISISLSVTSTELTSGTKPQATITIHNRSGSPISLKSFGQFTLTLELKDRPYAFCRISECYNAAFFPRVKVLPNNAAISFVAKLYDAYWHNSISSIQPANYPRNLFTGVEPGTYDLFAELSVKADNWTAADPRYFHIKSNEVSPVIISRRK
jgi:hypothetical protein